MPPEVVEIPVSREPLYEAVATFLGALAYPEDSQRRERAAYAWCRETLRISAQARDNSEFARERYPYFRPVWLAMSDKAAEIEMDSLAKRLGERKSAASYTESLIQEALDGHKKARLYAYGTSFVNNQEGRALLTNAWLRSKDTGTKNINRKLNPSRAVLHAVHAYWKCIQVQKRLTANADEQAVERWLVSNRDAFAAMLVVAGELRRKIPSINELRISESDLIEFRAV